MEPGFPRISHISAYICSSSGWASVIVRPLKAGKYFIIDRQFVIFRIVWMAFRIRDNHEMGALRWERRQPFHSDAITTLGNNNAAFILLLSFAKVSNTKDLLNRQTCHGILLCLHPVTSQSDDPYDASPCTRQHSMRTQQFRRWHCETRTVRACTL